VCGRHLVSFSAAGCPVCCARTRVCRRSLAIGRLRIMSNASSGHIRMTTLHLDARACRRPSPWRGRCTLVGWNDCRLGVCLSVGRASSAGRLYASLTRLRGGGSEFGRVCSRGPIGHGANGARRSARHGRRSCGARLIGERQASKVRREHTLWQFESPQGTGG
jgi:hypothetical protein